MMGTFPVLTALSIIAAFSINKVTAECVDDEHIYECRAVDEEAEDLTCSECYPTREDDHYNCSCWTNPANAEEEEDVYLSCQDAYMHGETENGTYTLKPDNLPSFKAFCDMETDGGGWTVIQRRMDGSVDFYLGWAEYIHGFGNISGEYWLGLSKIHRLTNSSMPSTLRVNFEYYGSDWKPFAVYSSFYIGGPSTDYQLHVKGYSGTAEDSMNYNNGRKFTTKDNDNDAYSGNCADHHHSGWWHASCTNANLNGRYYSSYTTNNDKLFWVLHGGRCSLNYAQMMIRVNSD